MNDLADVLAPQPGASRRQCALLRHEWNIALAAASVLGRKLVDLLTVLLVLPVFLLVLRAWTASQSEQLIRLQAFAVAFLVAFYCVTALLRRAAYHRTDGILAADAQRTSEHMAFALPLFGAAAAFGVAYLVIVTAYRPTLWLLGTILGVMAGFAWAHIVRTLREWQFGVLCGLKPPYLWRAGSRIKLAAGATLLGTAGAFLPLNPTAIVFAALAFSLLVGIVLAQVDAEAIRYRTMMGHSSVAVIRSHVLPLLAFFAPFATVLSLAPHWAASAITLVVGIAVTLFLAVRILAYQSFGRRIADWLVTILMAATAMVGLALPPVAPLVMLAGIIWLARRAAAHTWLIA